MDFAAQGDKALEGKDYKTAIANYTKALTIHPTSPAYHIKRSTAYLRLRPADNGPRYVESLSDSELAILLARQRGKRELMLEAQLRRGIALYHLERYGDAKCCLDEVRRAYPADSTAKKPKELATLDVWETKVAMQIRSEGEESDKARVTIQRIPDIPVPSEEELRKRYTEMAEGDVTMSAGDQLLADTNKNDSSGAEGSASNPSQNQSASAAAGVSAQDIRHEWYQTHDDLVLTFYAKGISREQADFDFQERSFTVTITIGPSNDYCFALDPLYYPIDPPASSFKIMSMKIEVRLRKKTTGQKWPTLEGNKDDQGPGSTVPAISNPPLAQASTTAAASAAAAAATSRPTYPTSSRKGAKDWDKLAAELAKVEKEKAKSEKQQQVQDGKESQGETTSTADDYDSDDSEYGADPVDKFFKKLYAGADPDTRRAMMKSYVESEGTALSTNWSEVGNKKVEPHNKD